MLISFCMRGCGRSERPAFPAPSDSSRRRKLAQLGRNPRRGIVNAHLKFCRGCLKFESLEFGPGRHRPRKRAIQ
jgi:hypothetical protein